MCLLKKGWKKAIKNVRNVEVKKWLRESYVRTNKK